MTDDPFAAFAAAPPPAWDDEQDGRLICRAIRHETHDVKTFTFSAPEPRLFRFAPGQFITFEFAVEGAAVHRFYTIASPPTRPYAIAVTVKRAAGGRVSNWLYDRLKVGDEVRASGPFGAFTPPGRDSRKILFLSGGSGVTPLMSMTRAFYDLGEDRDIIFLHSARTPRDIIFHDELQAMARRQRNFRTVFIVGDAASAPDWSGYRGRLSRPVLDLVAPDFRERGIFCCGPAAYMACVRTMLADAGFDMRRYSEESFNFDSHATLQAPAAPVEGGVQTFKIEFSRSGRVVECGADTHILDAAAAAGLRLPHSCAKGVCGTCKSRKLSGDVVMTHGGGIRQREIDQGMILICCSKPLSNVVIER